MADYKYQQKVYIGSNPVAAVVSGSTGLLSEAKIRQGTTQIQGDSIVTNGLTAYWDVHNLASWDGTGGADTADAYWKDISGNGRHLTSSQNIINSSSIPVYATYLGSKCFRIGNLDTGGGSGNVQIPASAASSVSPAVWYIPSSSLDIQTNGEYTFEVWCALAVGAIDSSAADVSSYKIISKKDAWGNSNQVQYALGAGDTAPTVYNAGTVWVQNDDPVSDQSGTSNWDDGYWRLLTVIGDANSVSFYQNGQFVNTQVLDNGFRTDTDAPFVIGAEGLSDAAPWSRSCPWSGYVSAVRAYNRKLTAEEIMWNYNQDKEYYEPNIS